MVFRWLQAGNDIANMKPKSHHKWKLTKNHEAGATSAQSLHEIANLYLIDWAEVIRQRFDLNKYSHSAVARHKKSYRKPQYAYSMKEAQQKELI